MDGNETNKLVKGALLLTLAGLISKILSAGYRIPLQNMTGDLGFYIYQQVYPILGITMVLALYGFPSAISKMTVELKADGKGLSFQQFYVPIFSILILVNGGVFLFLYLNAGSLAAWVGDASLESTYQYASFAFLLIPFSALLRGVFQGNYMMKPTAYSQVSEQLIRVSIIIAAAWIITMQGKDIYIIGQVAVLASVLGAVTAVIILAVFFIKKKPTVMAKRNYLIPWTYYVRTLLIFGIIASLNHMVLLVIQFSDTFTLIPSLMEYGLMQQDAMQAKGIFDRGQPLIQLGTVLGSSFALALVPTLSRRKLELDPNAIYLYIERALTFSFYLAVGATIGLIVIFPQVNVLLFQDDSGTVSLQVLVIAVLLSSIAITAASILQGLGYIKRTAGFIVIACFIKWTANQMLVPIWGITGGAIATVISLLILCVIVLVELKRKLPRLDYKRQIKWQALMIASGGMVIYLYIIQYATTYVTISSRLELLVYVMFAVITGAFIYIFLLLRFKAYTEVELSMLPFAGFFIRIHKGRNIHD
ncbi:oligosaccharide flippase family protein [Virgibacillus byunsanensis]|uniref:Oligosaccharide flippase family protein n=1 Tax=Virgibacillus byunsanensis TaxID=570945 RepID=A0ABW3LQF5_9BACI